uniref:Uncharacterized protein n=1 Tax=Mola mola TaxID=94237 RepID=A0A3Q3WJN9_MOLML
MAEVDFSLLSLEEELTCSICLSPFDCPVTIPCGHNFCQDCLLQSWTDSYSCPQCRTVFATKPELKKNTVLSSVVGTFKLRSRKDELDLSTEEGPATKQDVIRCDTCMEAAAAQTCLTCMASFCEEHLRPHRENPNFRVHQLSEPVGDLLDRICSDHHKLMEFFCSEHGHLICSFCLQQVHKGCSFMSPEEQRHIRESDLRGKLSLLDGKIMKNNNVITQMKGMQKKLKVTLATNRKKALSADYQLLKDMLAREECDALNAVDSELESGHTKLKTLMKKFTGNVDNMSTAKEGIHSLLGKSQTLAFLQASFNMPTAVNFDPYTPRINLDSKKVIASQAFASALKVHLIEILKQPIDARLLRLKASESAGTFPLEYFNIWKHVKQRVSHVNVVLLLLYSPDATVLTLDPKTAHKRIALSEGLTKATVSEEHLNYPDHRKRFTVCSQVMASKGFSRGRHYWEVQLSSNNFIGIGLAYDSIDRIGPNSRLGRNAQSWCLEWFNIKLSVWYESRETTVLVNPSPKRVGVLLDCEGGTATFYNVTDKAYPFHSFVFPFAEAVYPAFWIFSSGSSVSLCKLQA